jgi:hypothetical protein
MKKIILLSVFAFLLSSVGSSSYQVICVQTQNTELKKPPHTWIGYYHDTSTGDNVYICILNSDFSTVIAARLNTCCDDATSSSAGGTYSSANQSVSNFHTTINGHTYNYSGPITLL